MESTPAVIAHNINDAKAISYLLVLYGVSFRLRHAHVRPFETWAFYGAFGAHKYGDDWSVIPHTRKQARLRRTQHA